MAKRVTVGGSNEERSFLAFSGSSPPQGGKGGTEAASPEGENGLEGEDLQALESEVVFDNEIMTVSTAAKKANVCTKTIYNEVRNGHLVAKRIGRGKRKGIRILGSALIEWMKGGNYAD